MTDIDQIKKRLDLVDFIKEYLPLKQAGVNFKAKCPFHNEKTASLIISPEKQIWHCFGCSEGGDLFGWLMKMEHLEFPEALRILAQKAGVTLTQKSPEQQNQKIRLLDLIESAQEFFLANLKSDTGRTAREYLSSRQIAPDAEKIFGLGLASDSWDDLIKFLLNKKYSLREITLAGLATSNGTKVYNRFRNRIMFPIKDLHGNIVGFGGRALDPNEKMGKYINSPQSEVYNKSGILYNLDLAKTEVRRMNYLILVEGYMDVISAYASGTKNVASVSGTALTSEQIDLVKRLTNNIMIAFDADPAGVQANLRGIDLAWAAGLNVKVVKITNAKDPDELIKRDPALWHGAVKNAANFMDYAFEAAAKGCDLTRIDHKKTLAKKLLLLINKLGDNIERDHYLKKAASILEISEDVLRSALQPVVATKTSPVVMAPEISWPKVKLARIQKLLALLHYDHDLWQNVPAGFEEIIDNLEYKNLYIYLKNNYNDGDNQAIEKPVSLSEIELLSESELVNLSPKEQQNEFHLLLSKLWRDHWQAVLIAEQQKLVKEEKKLPQERSNEVATRINNILNKLQLFE